MEEKRNYVVYIDDRFCNDTERVIKMSAAQADAIQWFMNNFDINGSVTVAEEYEGEEI